jgi:hypothetical protein
MTEHTDWVAKRVSMLNRSERSKQGSFCGLDESWGKKHGLANAIELRK